MPNHCGINLLLRLKYMMRFETYNLLPTKGQLISKCPLMSKKPIKVL